MVNTMRDPMMQAMLQAVFDEDDRVRADLEEWQAKRQEIKWKNSPDMRYSDPSDLSEMQPETKPMTSRDEGWCDWFRAMLHVEMQPDGMLCENIAFALSEIRHQVREEFKAQDDTLRLIIDAQRTEIAELRRQIEMLRAHNVTELRGRDAA